MQLNLFDNVNGIDEELLKNCGALVRTGIINRDFVFFNPLNAELMDVQPIITEIELIENDFWRNIKSIAWSASCRFFFVVNENSIILGSVYEYKAFLCQKLSKNFISYFIEYKGILNFKSNECNRKTR
jgi:hypothetical protein